MRGLVVVSFAGLVACDVAFDIEAKRHVAEPPDGNSAPDASTPGGSPGERPPPPPSGTSDAPSRAVAFIAQGFRFGAAGDAGAPDPRAWRQIGYDIDGVQSAEPRALDENPGTCRRNPGSRSDVLLDGEAGRDNALGSQIVRLAGEFGQSAESLEQDLTSTVVAGGPSLMVLLRELSDGPDDVEVDVGIFSTVKGDRLWFRDPPAPPPYTSIDARSVVPDTLTPVLHFPRAYMTGNVVVAGSLHEAPPGPLFLPVTSGALPVSVRPLSLVLTLELGTDHHAVLRSTLAFVSTVADAATWLAPSAVSWGLPACDRPGRDDLEALLLPLTDLRSDRASFLDAPGATLCDALSMAMHVAWREVRIPLAESVVVVSPDGGACPGAP